MNEPEPYSWQVPGENRISPNGGPVMSEPATAPAVSPTGKPVIGPAAVPWLAAGWAGVVALVEALPEGGVKTWAKLGLLVAGPILGVLAPGWRR